MVLVSGGIIWAMQGSWLATGDTALQAPGDVRCGAGSEDIGLPGGAWGGREAGGGGEAPPSGRASGAVPGGGAAVAGQRRGHRPGDQWQPGGLVAPRCHVAARAPLLDKRSLNSRVFSLGCRPM